MNDDWLEDTTDVLHCSMPPQVRQHIEELRDEVARLRAAEVPLSTNVGFAIQNQGEVWGDSGERAWSSDAHWVAPYATADDALGCCTEANDVAVALIPLTAWDRT